MPTTNRFPNSLPIIVRWAYLLDNIPDEFGGGSSSGEFGLLVDGRLLRRTVFSETTRDTTSWRAGPWEPDAHWAPSTNILALFDNLASRGYELYSATPVRVNATTAGPSPGSPPVAGEPLRREHVSGFSPDLFKRALDFAAAVHGSQTVPGSGFPYVVHVAKVAMEVLAATEGEVSLDRNLAVACALLHDTVEDSAEANRDAVRARIRVEFGAAVAAGVDALTKDDALPKPGRMADSLARIKAQPREVRLVKLADRITNLEPPPPDWTLEKRRAYLEEAKTILNELGDASERLRRRLQEKRVQYEQHCR